MEAFAGRPLPRSITSLIGWSFRAHQCFAPLPGYCRGLSEVDQDLLFTGALFTILQIYEFDYQYAIDYTDAGRLLGHIVMGVDLVHQRLRKITVSTVFV